MEENKIVKPIPSAIAFARAAAISTTTLIVLKSMNEINWDWKWILSPIWVPLIFNFIYAILTGVVIGYSKMNSR